MNKLFTLIFQGFIGIIFAVASSISITTNCTNIIDFALTDDLISVCNASDSASIQEPFVFTVVTDSHLGTDEHCDPELYEQTMKNLALDRPTLHFDLGDTFRSSKVVDPDYEKIENLYISQKPFFEYAAQSAQIYLVIGNHELEYGYLLDGTENNIPIWSTKARKLYYPNPEPDDFYTGNSREYEFIGKRQNYYAFTWRDTLFIALDPYWTTMIEPHGKNSTLWDSTIGDEQYQWFKETVEKSNAKFKFVFIHHILGETRGGIEAAKRGEWGDTINLKKYRPNWEKTIHQLIADNNVNIVFQGHDHIFVRQELDGVIYQTCPMPGDPYYAMVNADAFLTGDKVANSGHVRVAVSYSGIKVYYIRAFLPEDEKNGHKNGETGFSYTLADSGEKRYEILTDTSPALPIPKGSYIQVIGSKGGNTINVESGAAVECIHFVGADIININEVSSNFTVYRSGATVYLQSTLGTKIKLPATLTAQTLNFTDTTFKLQIKSGKVMLGDKVVTTESKKISSGNPNITYPVVDTAQTKCYNDLAEITCPLSGTSFYGQDSQNNGNSPSYTDNGDGTITDNVTDLIWQQSPDFNNDGSIKADDKMTYSEAVDGADSFNLAGYTDWRLPTIKELYSLILFSGIDPSGYNGTSTSGLIPFIDTKYFAFGYGDTTSGERIIDAQFASSTKYLSTTMNGSETMFGVNFADGRIKGYGTDPMPGQRTEKTFYVLYVRGNTNYGKNSFIDNKDGTITDSATKLTWSQDDSGVGMNWEDALAWVQQKNSEKYLGYSDWRLPNAKELQSIVDYTRSPDTISSAAIDPMFKVSSITNEDREVDYPFYWTSTTHANWSTTSGGNAAYIAFGRGLGYMNGSWLDVHGAGCQRSDPKSGDSSDYPTGHGPQGDAIRIYNYVRCVRN